MHLFLLLSIACIFRFPIAPSSRPFRRYVCEPFSGYVCGGALKSPIAGANPSVEYMYNIYTCM